MPVFNCIAYVVVIVGLEIIQTGVNSKLVRHSFEIDYFTGDARPDGVATSYSLRINGQFPGPTIQAMVGDILQVDVTNKIRDGQNTTIHWHGIHQRGFPFADGPNMVTQCPLKSGVTHRYRFRLQQSGTYWYHSHVGSQYSEGLWGALIIRNKNEIYKYEDEMTITLNDWYHRSAQDNEQWYLTTGIIPLPDSLLLNGLGRYPCNGTMANNLCSESQQLRHVFNVTEGQRYRVRVINSSSRTTFNFSIDDHVLETIEIDGVDVLRPVSANIAEIGPAQRYSFIITANRKDSTRFLIRGEGNLGPPSGERPGQCGSCPFREVTAVLQYVRRNIFRPGNHQITSGTEPYNYLEIVPPKSTNNRMQVLDERYLIPHDQVLAPSRVDHTIVLESRRRSQNMNEVQHFAFNSTRFQLPTDKPLLHQVIDNDNIPNNFPNVRLRLNSVVQVVVYNFGVAHPLHLHGHHFNVVGKFPMRLDSNGNPERFDERVDKIALQSPRRDTVIVPNGYILVIRFRADNPGVWIFHCHIDWHSYAGMGFAFIEAPEIIQRNFKITKEQRRLCS